MLDTIRRLRILSVDTVEDVKDGLLYIQFLSFDTTIIFQTGPFLVSTKNPVFS